MPFSAQFAHGYNSKYLRVAAWMNDTIEVQVKMVDAVSYGTIVTWEHVLDDARISLAQPHKKCRNTHGDCKCIVSESALSSTAEVRHRGESEMQDHQEPPADENIEEVFVFDINIKCSFLT